MSGFRKFRTTVHRRRRAALAELGHLAGGPPAEIEPEVPEDPAAAPLEFSPSREAVEIGPAPIAWMKPRKPETEN